MISQLSSLFIVTRVYSSALTTFLSVPVALSLFCLSRPYCCLIHKVTSSNPEMEKIIDVIRKIITEMNSTRFTGMLTLTFSFQSGGIQNIRSRVENNLTLTKKIKQ